MFKCSFAAIMFACHLSAAALDFWPSVPCQQPDMTITVNSAPLAPLPARAVAPSISLAAAPNDHFADAGKMVPARSVQNADGSTTIFPIDEFNERGERIISRTYGFLAQPDGRNTSSVNWATPAIQPLPPQNLQPLWLQSAPAYQPMPAFQVQQSRPLGVCSQPGMCGIGGCVGGSCSSCATCPNGMCGR